MLSVSLWTYVYGFLSNEDLVTVNDLFIIFQYKSKSKHLLPKPPVLFHAVVHQYDVLISRLFKIERMAYQCILDDLVTRINRVYSGNYGQYVMETKERKKDSDLICHSHKPLHNHRFEDSLEISSSIHVNEDRYVNEEDRERCDVWIRVSRQFRLKKEYQTLDIVAFLLKEYQPVQHYMSPELRWKVVPIRIE